MAYRFPGGVPFIAEGIRHANAPITSQTDVIKFAAIRKLTDLLSQLERSPTPEQVLAGAKAHRATAQAAYFAACLMIDHAEEGLGLKPTEAALPAVEVPHDVTEPEHLEEPKEVKEALFPGKNHQRKPA